MPYIIVSVSLIFGTAVTLALTSGGDTGDTGEAVYGGLVGAVCALVLFLMLVGLMSLDII